VNAIVSASDEQSRSLWRATAAPAPATVSLEGGERADVAIVGAGYTGLCCAIALAEAGKKVVVLEAHEIGNGGSGRNGGQVIPGLALDPDDIVSRFGRERGDALARLAGGAADRLFALIAKYRIDCAATQCGWIEPAHSAAAARTIVARARHWKARHAPVELLSGLRLADALGTDAYSAGWLDRRGGALQPLSYARGLARVAVDAGALLHTRSPATRLLRNSREWALRTPRGEVRARQVVLATDAYSGALWPELARNQIVVISAQTATVPLPDSIRRGILAHGNVVSDTRTLQYCFRFDSEGRFVIGGRASAADAAPDRVYAMLRRVAVRMYPELADVQWPFRWHGRVGITRDGIPHLAEVAPGVWAALGYCGRGVAMATTMGLVLGDMLSAGGRLSYPVASLVPISLRSLRVPVLRASMAYHRLRDTMSNRSLGVDRGSRT
jgi:glycine/D-amino acid oxidase-like deaminating enzyme